ncbi:MAG: hypothetical protein JNK55_21180 [Rubrivivax sp.]|nr:hypothetical protein [Rubrivivax sp.]
MSTHRKHWREALATLAACALWQAVPVQATAARSEPSADDRTCLDCHGPQEPGSVGSAVASKIQEGRRVPRIDVAAYLSSVHGDAGCISCHDQVRLPAHPGKAQASDERPRKAPGAVIPMCRSCHPKVVKAFDRSIHAEAVRARSRSAPDCNGCHVPHAVTTASVQEGPKNACLDCHDDPAQTHRSWLPNAARHLQAVACAACHAPEALLRTDLRLTVQNGQGAARIAEGFEPLATRMDANRDGLDAHEFRALIEALEQQGLKVAVRGRIELRNGIQAHWLPEKSRALRDCFGCHDEDAPPYKSVTVSTLDAQGGPVRHDAQREILTSAITVEALKGFYALGGTRLAALDLVLALGLLLGISVPALHLLIRRVLARPHPSTE